MDITFQLDGDPAAWEKMANDRHARFLLAYDAQQLAVLGRGAVQDRP